MNLLIEAGVSSFQKLMVQACPFGPLISSYAVVFEISDTVALKEIWAVLGEQNKCAFLLGKTFLEKALNYSKFDSEISGVCWNFITHVTIHEKIVQIKILS